MPAGPAGALGALGSPVFLHVHTHVREDAILLYGFGSREERVCFEALIGAHGVGPAVALSLLSVHSPAALQRAVLSDDLDALMLVPGIGRKTAARLVIELKSRLEADLDGSGSADGRAGRDQRRVPTPPIGTPTSATPSPPSATAPRRSAWPWPVSPPRARWRTT